ncbi:MAG: RecX family transcriptional regulator [Chitinophagales bacterium]
MDEKILNKLRHYCAYQERCHEEVRSKLLELKVYGDALEEIIGTLISENFLNEERFAKLYAGGKFRMKQWGREKILGELKKRKISDYCIRKGMAEIEEEDYLHTLDTLIKKHLKKHKPDGPYIAKNKTAKYLISRGYEAPLVWARLKE